MKKIGDMPSHIWWGNRSLLYAPKQVSQMSKAPFRWPHYPWPASARWSSVVSQTIAASPRSRETRPEKQSWRRPMEFLAARTECWGQMTWSTTSHTKKNIPFHFHQKNWDWIQPKKQSTNHHPLGGSSPSQVGKSIRTALYGYCTCFFAVNPNHKLDHLLCIKETRTLGCSHYGLLSLHFMVVQIPETKLRGAIVPEAWIIHVWMILLSKTSHQPQVSHVVAVPQKISPNFLNFPQPHPNSFKMQQENTIKNHQKLSKNDQSPL